MQKIQDSASKASRFLTQEIWRIETGELSGIKTFFISILRIISLTVHKFIKDNCALRASALTFYSLMSVVPMLALAFGIAKGFGLEQRLEYQLYQRLTGQEEVLKLIIAFARGLLENTKGGVIAGIGVAILFWSAIRLLGNIEKALNEIWKVTPRTFIRRFTDYLTIMIVSPILVIVSSSVTVYITTEVKAITGKLAVLKMASPLIFFMLKLLPFGLIWLLFIMVYLVMPNTQVRLLSGAIAGVIAGTIFQIFQGIYISAQVIVAKYNAIYGSFAALPLFLIWLQLSWIIVLAGAQIAYAHQHAGHGHLAIEARKASDRTRKIYGLMILKYIIGCFEKGASAPSVKQISSALHLPIAMVIQLLQALKECSLISEVIGNQSNTQTFQPARDIQTITVSHFLASWERVGRNPILSKTVEELTRIEGTLEQIGETIERSQGNRLVKDL
jgi:membrane protein